MNDKKKIALVCTSMNELGGKNNHLKNIYLSLSAFGFDIRLILCSGIESEQRSFFLQGGIPREHLIFLSQTKKRLVVPFLFELWRIFQKEQFDIVHTFQIQSDILASFPARLAGVPILLSYYESKLIEDNVPIVKQQIYYLINRFIKKWFLKTIMVSNGLKEEARDLHFRHEGTVEFIHLGIKASAVEGKRKNDFQNLKKGSPVIGTIGRFSHEKGLSAFVKAIPLIIKEIPQASFLVVGKGPMEMELRGLADQLNISDRVTFQPWVSDVYTKIQELDVFVMPSQREGCPTALLEAMLMSCPVVASDIPGISDIVEHKINGILFPRGDVKRLAQAVIDLCKDPAVTIEIGRKGYERVLSSFTIEQEMTHLRDVYLSILKTGDGENIRKILIMELWGIGDVVMMSAILSPLSRAFPNAEIWVLAQAHGREILKENKEVSRFFVFKFPWTAFRKKYHFWRWDWRGLIKTVLSLRRERFDLVLDARGDPRNSILSFLINGRKTIGLRNAEKKRSLHRITQWGCVLARAGVSWDKLYPAMTITSEERAGFLKFVVEKFPLTHKILVGLHLGAAQKIRRWPQDRFKDLALRLMRYKDTSILVLADPDGYGREVAVELDLACFQGNLREVSAIISELDLLVCNDTGVMHIATAVGIPVVAVFGPGDPGYIGPYGEGEVVIKDCPYRPCFDACRKISVECLERISVDDVWYVIQSKLSGFEKRRNQCRRVG